MSIQELTAAIENLESQPASVLNNGLIAFYEARRDHLLLMIASGANAILKTT